MKAKISAAVGIVAAIAGMYGKVQAQSPSVPTTTTEQYTLSGDSLEGINNRTTNKDFASFFIPQTNAIDQTSRNSRETKKNIVDPYLGRWQVNSRVQLQKVNQLSSSTNTPPIIFQPAQSVNGNDGLQVQLGINR